MQLLPCLHQPSRLPLHRVHSFRGSLPASHCTSIPSIVLTDAASCLASAMLGIFMIQASARSSSGSAPFRISTFHIRVSNVVANCSPLTLGGRFLTWTQNWISFEAMVCSSVKTNIFFSLQDHFKRALGRRLFRLHADLTCADLTFSILTWTPLMVCLRLLRIARSTESWLQVVGP